MTRINTRKLIDQATDLSDIANVIRKDPAALKACKEAVSDIGQAVRSTKLAVLETKSACGRASDRRLRPAQEL